MNALQDTSAEDLLLALLRASPSATDSRPSSAAQSQPSSALQPLAREASSTLRDALPHPAAAANSNIARAQQVRSTDRSHCVPTKGICVPMYGSNPHTNKSG